jgi:hypothetical protein
VAALDLGAFFWEARRDRFRALKHRIGFEIPNLLAQGRLGGVQAVRGAAEMQIFRDRDEVAEVQ